MGAGKIKFVRTSRASRAAAEGRPRSTNCQPYPGKTRKIIQDHREVAAIDRRVEAETRALHEEQRRQAGHPGQPPELCPDVPPIPATPLAVSTEPYGEDAVRFIQEAMNDGKNLKAIAQLLTEQEDIRRPDGLPWSLGIVKRIVRENAMRTRRRVRPPASCP